MRKALKRKTKVQLRLPTLRTQLVGMSILDMVLSLGFRVRSPVGVRFRQCANDKLKEYIVKGFVLDDACLKNPGKGRDYFDELSHRLHGIRTSEWRF